jgi:CheY-like chemotaxis protein
MTQNDRRPPAALAETEPRAAPTEGRLHRVALAAMRDEFQAPVTAIIDGSELLLQECGALDRADFTGDLRKVHDSGRELLALVNEVLAQPPDGVAPDLKVVQSRLRHDMLNALNTVINYCEMWVEDAPECFLEGFADDLRAIQKAGRACLALTDRILSCRPGAADLDVAELIAVTRLPDGRRGAPGDRDEGRLLVVDDNDTNRDILTRRLRRQGHQVWQAPNGATALDRIRSQPFDLVLLDIMMPEMNGFQVLEALKSDGRLRDIPVLMISALDELEAVVSCIELGADDYLLKPFNPMLLAARIGACLERKRLRDREVLHLAEIDRERRRADELLHVILPAAVVDELKATNAVRPRSHDDVAVLFADIVGFTPYCDRNPPAQVLSHLQRLVEEWEEIALVHGVQKIKTLGDAVMAAAGLLDPVDNPVLRCIRCGQDMIAAAHRVLSSWDLRVGIHVGPVVAGVLGRRQYLFDLWGDTVNTAARMESHGVPGAITLSEAAWRRVAHCCRAESRGGVDVKGKGRLEVFRFTGFVGDQPGPRPPQPARANGGRAGAPSPEGAPANSTT